MRFLHVGTLFFSLLVSRGHSFLVKVLYCFNTICTRRMPTFQLPVYITYLFFLNKEANGGMDFFHFWCRKANKIWSNKNFSWYFYYKNDKDILLRENQQTSVFPKYKITKKYQGVQRSTKKYMYVSTGVIMIKKVLFGEIIDSLRIDRSNSIKNIENRKLILIEHDY